MDGLSITVGQFRFDIGLGNILNVTNHVCFPFCGIDLSSTYSLKIYVQTAINKKLANYTKIPIILSV
jgi:hypothetical protein